MVFLIYEKIRGQPATRRSGSGRHMRGFGNSLLDAVVLYLDVTRLSSDRRRARPDTQVISSAGIIAQNRRGPTFFFAQLS